VSLTHLALTDVRHYLKVRLITRLLLVYPLVTGFCFAGAFTTCLLVVDFFFPQLQAIFYILVKLMLYLFSNLVECAQELQFVHVPLEVINE
jgi:hypothetical protein